jgi:hypothetical protein
MEALSSSETSVLTKATRRYIPKDATLRGHHRENLKSYKMRTCLTSWLLWWTHWLHAVREYLHTWFRAGNSLSLPLTRERTLTTLRLVMCLEASAAWMLDRSRMKSREEVASAPAMARISIWGAAFISDPFHLLGRHDVTCSSFGLGTRFVFLVSYNCRWRPVVSMETKCKTSLSNLRHGKGSALIRGSI